MIPLHNLRLVGYGVAILAVFSSGWHVNGMRWEAKLKTALERQMIELVARCEEDKEITAKAAESYENKISTLSNRVASLKRVSATKCVPIANTASVTHGSPATGLSNANGITASELVDYAGDAEKVRQQLISLQDFVRDVWKQ